MNPGPPKKSKTGAKEAYATGCKRAMPNAQAWGGGGGAPTLVTALGGVKRNGLLLARDDKRGTQPLSHVIIMCAAARPSAQ